MIYIKRAKAEDALLLAEIKARALREEIRTYFGRCTKLSNLINIDSVQTEKKRHQEYKILLNDTTIGVFFLTDLGDGRMQFEDFAIEPEYQGRGYAFRVLQMIEKIFPKIKVWSLTTLACSVGNQHLYEKAGFIEVSRDDWEVEYEKINTGTMENVI